jgi:hypothetical protein
LKNRFKHLIALGVVTVTLISNHFIVYGAEKPIPPEEITGELTNDKIKAYNSEVEEYNKKVDTYNDEVDKEYEAEIASIKQQNEEIDTFNESEKQRAAAAKENNVQIQADYDAACAQYQTDLENEAKIKEKGFESVEAYNEYINGFNQIAAEKSAKNSNASTFDITKTYSIEKGEVVVTENEEDPYEDDIEHEPVQVNLTHNFMGFNTFTTSFTIEEGDTITFYGAGAQFEQTEPGAAQFYMNSDNNHLEGDWNQSFSQLMCTANINEDDWNAGDIHIVSYREGKKHSSDSTDIDMEYYYYWRVAPTGKTYNVPKEPTLELEDEEEHIKEHIANPDKPEHLTYISTKDLIEETPEPEQPQIQPEPEQPQPEDDKPQPKPKKKKKKPKKENAETPVYEEQTQEEEPEPAPAQITKQTQPIVETPTPQQTKTIIKARQAQTGDYTATKLRIAILISCLVILVIFFFPKKEKQKDNDLP